MLRALLFDMDGTLANTDPWHMKAWQDELAKNNIHISEHEYNTSISGRLNPDIVHDYLPDLTNEQVQSLIARKEARFRELVQTLTPLDGLSELITWGQAHALAFALVTNATKENMQFVIKALKLNEQFKAQVLPEDAGAGKPDPAPYLLALELLGVEACDAVVFEDSPSGVRSGVAAGLRVVGVTTTQPAQVLLSAGAVLTVPDFTHEALWTFLRPLVKG